jgi:hypothetical protein
MLLKRPDGWKLDRTFSTQWRVRTERHIIRTDDAWSVWSPDGMARRPDGIVTDGRPNGMAQFSGRLIGNCKYSDSEALLNRRIPVKHLYT